MFVSLFFHAMLSSNGCPWWTHSIYFYLDSEFFSFFCLCYGLSFAQTFPSHLFCSFGNCVCVCTRVYVCYCLWTMQFLTIQWENDSEWSRSVNEIFINLPYTLHTRARAYVQYSFRAIFPIHRLAPKNINSESHDKICLKVTQSQDDSMGLPWNKSHFSMR